jgi:hypothetical protein
MIRHVILMSFPANEHFQQVKAQSKEILEESRRVLNEAGPEVREEYNEIEEVRLQYEREEKEAKERGLPPPDGSAVDFRTVDELKAELATQRAKLDLTMNTNQHIVDEFEKRKRDVRFLLARFLAALTIGVSRSKPLRKRWPRGRRGSKRFRRLSRTPE